MADGEERERLERWFDQNFEDTEDIVEGGLEVGDVVIHETKGRATVVKPYKSGCQIQIEGKKGKDFVKWFDLQREWKRLVAKSGKEAESAEGEEGGQPEASKPSKPKPSKTQAEASQGEGDAKHRQKEEGKRGKHGKGGEGEGGAGEEGEGVCPLCHGTGKSPWGKDSGEEQALQEDALYVSEELLPRLNWIDKLNVPDWVKRVIAERITRHKYFAEEEKHKGGRREIPSATEKQIKLLNDLMSEVGYKKSVPDVLALLNVEQASKAIDDLMSKKKGGSNK